MKGGVPLFRVKIIKSGREDEARSRVERANAILVFSDCRTC